MGKPNFIIVNCDDLGYGDLGCYGSTLNQTPHIDEMAAEGMRFTDFYMASSVCSPSRAAMLTGCYPPRIGFGDLDGNAVLFPGDPIGLNPSEITIASLLKGVGYKTMLVGKWHCGDQPPFLPTHHGFDYYFGLPYSNDMGRQVESGREFPPLPLLRGSEVTQEQPDLTSLTERYVDAAVQFIRENRDSPFFLYFAHMYVHRPLYVPSRFLKESVNPYAAAVACIDWASGVLMHELKRLSIEDNTLVVFTSDNGSRCDYGKSNGSLRGGKFTTWEGGQRLPCIMRWPGTIPSGAECSELTASIDLLPTFAALAGLKPPQDRIIDGRDIGPLLKGEQTARSPHTAFFYYFKDDLEAMRSGKWKLHVRKQGKPTSELYDLVADVSESNNLYEAYPEVVHALELLLNECRDDIGDAALGVIGRNRRHVGRVDNPVTLTTYSPDHPYMVAMYDLSDRG